MLKADDACHEVSTSWDAASSSLNAPGWRPAILARRSRHLIPCQNNESDFKVLNINPCQGQGMGVFGLRNSETGRFRGAYRDIFTAFRKSGYPMTGFRFLSVKKGGIAEINLLRDKRAISASLR